MHNIKQKLIDACFQIVNDKLTFLKKSIAELQRSANEETKSSVGDKYETGRAMVQLEIEKLNMQLLEVNKQFETLSVLKPEENRGVVALGSLVATNKGKFFLSTSVGQVSVEGESYFCISMNSPIGLKLKNARTGDSFSINNSTFEIQEIF